MPVGYQETLRRLAIRSVESAASSLDVCLQWRNCLASLLPCFFLPHLPVLTQPPPSSSKDSVILHIKQSDIRGCASLHFLQRLDWAQNRVPMCGHRLVPLLWMEHHAGHGVSSL